LNNEAEEMYVRALRGYEKAWGAEHTSTLVTVNNLGVLYKNQGKMVEAEEMLLRALRGYEKAVGNDHWRTQKIARNLQKLRRQKQ
jgi:tetratricopeptide (TPR) repeat protein